MSYFVVGKRYFIKLYSTLYCIVLYNYIDLQHGFGKHPVADAERRT